jgi:hypothetical protein
MRRNGEIYNKKDKKKSIFKKMMDILNRIKDFLQPFYTIVFLIYVIVIVIIFIWGLVVGEAAKKFLITPLLNPIITFILIGVLIGLSFIIYRIWPKKIIVSQIKDGEQLRQIPVIKYGHINYPPLLSINSKTRKPSGIGLTLLERVLTKEKISDDKKLLTWDNFEEHLFKDHHDVDIIATPLFEFSTRLDRISFSSPLFYSEIGLYYSKKNKELSAINNQPITLNDSQIEIKRLIKSKNSKLKFVVIQGEISQYLVKKYFNLEIDCEHLKILDREGCEVAGLLTEVADEKDGQFLTFIETYQAETNPNFEKVANLLGPKQILYPVAFAMRKEHIKIRRFINLRLLQLDISSKYGVLDIIRDELKSMDDFLKNINDYEMEMEYIKKHFIREYEP